MTQETFLREIQTSHVVLQDVIPFLSELEKKQEYSIQDFQEAM